MTTQDWPYNSAETPDKVLRPGYIRENVKSQIGTLVLSYKCASGTRAYTSMAGLRPRAAAQAALSRLDHGGKMTMSAGLRKMSLNRDDPRLLVRSVNRPRRVIDGVA